MSPVEIQVGVTYVNRGAGRTQRTVLAIGDEHRPPHWLGAWGTKPPDEPGVLFEQKGKQYTLYLSSFAQWAKRPVECDHPWHRNPGLITDCPGCGAKLI
jgi:hypothetical protein